jgi:molybdopterin adenylyltransferase
MRFGVLTISDRSFRGERPDLSGPVLINLITLSGNLVEKNTIVPDELELIQNKLIEWADSGILDVILTTGGTGFAPRDITPEATRSIIDRFTPGLDEAMRFNSLKITPHAMLSRAISGIRKKTLIINLPGSPKAVTENFQFISPVLVHAINLLQDDPLAEKGH